MKARHFKVVPQRSIRLLVVHDMEWAASVRTAEDCAREFQTCETPKSAHICVDSDSIIQCVWDRHVAYAAPGANHDGIQMELAGFARQTRDQWQSGESAKVLENGARAGAQYALKFGLPIRRLSVPELLRGDRGFVGHGDVSLAYGRSTHTDPGPNFPWDEFLERVAFHRGALR